ncbi:MAG: hypothetical protein QM743_04515 [Chitinophagaceae bacterium]
MPGLIFSGYPGEAVKTRHIQASAQLFFSVFEELERNNLLLQQAFDEVMTFQMEEATAGRFATNAAATGTNCNASEIQPFLLPYTDRTVQGKIQQRKTRRPYTENAEAPRRIVPLRSLMRLCINDYILTLLPEKAIYIPHMKALAIADVHLGKARHFRREDCQCRYRHRTVTTNGLRIN